MRRMDWREGRADKDAGPLLQVAAWIGCLGLGVTAFMFVVSVVHFEYHLTEGIVSTSTWVNYPEQQETLFYGMGLAVIPVVAAIAYWVWSRLTGWLGRVRVDEIPSRVWTTVLMQLGWVPPLYLLLTKELDLLVIPIIAGLLVAGNAVLVVNRRLADRARETQLTLPSFRIQIEVMILGAGVGMSLPVSPLVSTLAIPSLWLLLLSGLFLWSLWMAGTYRVASRLKWNWSRFGEKCAIALLPLAALPWVDVFWSEVDRAGMRVAENIAWGRSGLSREVVS